MSGTPGARGHGAQPGPTYGKVDPTDPASEHDPERLGFDCSGLVRYAYARATGADILDGDASAQYYTHRTAARFHRGRGPSPPCAPGTCSAYGTSADLAPHRPHLGAGKMVEARQSGTKLMVSDVRLGGSYFGAVRVNTGAVEGPVFRTWGTGCGPRHSPPYGPPASTPSRTHHRPRRLARSTPRASPPRATPTTPGPTSRLPRLGHQHLHPGPGPLDGVPARTTWSRAGVRECVRTTRADGRPGHRDIVVHRALDTVKAELLGRMEDDQVEPRPFASSGQRAGRGGRPVRRGR